MKTKPVNSETQKSNVSQQFISRRSQEGQVILVVVLLMTLVLTVALTTNQAVLVNMKLSAENVRSEKAYYATEARVEELLYDLKEKVIVEPTLTPEVVGVTTAEGDSVDVGCTISFNKTVIGPIRLGVGETLQFQVLPNIHYGFIKFEWGDVAYTGDVANSPAVDVVFAGATPVAPSGSMQIDSNHFFFKPASQPYNFYKYSSYLYTEDSNPPAPTPAMDIQRTYSIRIKPYNTGTHDNLRISAWDVSGTVPAEVFEGIRTVDCTGDYLPGGGEKSDKRRVIAIVNEGGQLLYDVFDYSLYSRSDLDI
ncbi:MAG: PilX N-terminal domain-containing pilus assembly protein [bacterium]